jgi:hypothetical protein
MKKLNFILFAFVLSFVPQVSAQDEKPKIIWENLQEGSKDFVDVKPEIKNISDKTLLVYPEFDVDDILFFDNETNQWTSDKFIIGCGNSPNLRFVKSIKLKPNQSIRLSNWLDWDYLLLAPFDSFSHKDKANRNSIRYFKQDRKYKLVTFYSEKKNKGFKKVYSPEFWVKPTN